MREKCGLIGVYGTDFDAARLAYVGLWSLQHRGQESSGIASSDGRVIRVIKGEGLVAHVYDEKKLELLDGNIAIGHNRYSTSGGSDSRHIQPIIDADRSLAMAHNGNLPSTHKLETLLRKQDIDIRGLNDSELMFAAIKYYSTSGQTLEHAIKLSWPLFTGAFCLLFMTADKLVAVRDSRGIRPLVLGKLNGQWVVASETCALDTLGADFVREVAPGEMVIIDKHGVKSEFLARGRVNLDIFEFVYFARPDSVIMGKLVNETRRRMGINLAKEKHIAADVVIPIPDSAIPAALGYSHQSGIPFDHGLIKNRYIHRTFIRPAQKLREKDITVKLNPLKGFFTGKRVIVVDDSIVRGTTSKKIVGLLQAAGAAEVHLVISSPPVKFPDFYGIDTPKQEDLIAAVKSIDEIRDYIHADTLQYLSYPGLIDAIGLPENMLCTSCLTGRYPISIGPRKKSVKFGL